jgi:hypothetical protein
MLHVKLSGRFLRVGVAVRSRRIILVAVGDLRVCHDAIRVILIGSIVQRDEWLVF